MQSTIKTPYCLPIDGEASSSPVYVYPNAGTTDSRLYLVCEGSGKKSRNSPFCGSFVGRKPLRIFSATPPARRQAGWAAIRKRSPAICGNVACKSIYTKTPAAKGMGATFSLLYLNDDGTATLAWAGNCRAYHIRGGQLLHRTDDHLVNTFKDGKTITLPRRVTGRKLPLGPALRCANPVPTTTFFYATRSLRKVWRTVI